MYIFNDDEIGRIVLDALQLAQARGVKIFVVADAFGSNALTSDYIKTLKELGIYFRYFSRISLFRNLNLGRRLHHKLVVSDYTNALVGGVNIADKYYKPTDADVWLDFAVFIQGPICAKLERICQAIAKRKFYPLQLGSNKNRYSAKPTQISIRQNDWLRNKKQIYQSYELALRNAEKQVLIFASYFLPGHKLRNTLEATARRGVQITIVLPGISDIPLILNATYYLYDWLHKNNIRIFEWKKSVLHAKLAIVDDEWMTVGSFNLNVLSTYASLETNIDIYDANFIIKSRDRLNSLIETGCEEILQNRKRSFFVKAREAIAYVLGRVVIRTITFFPNFQIIYSKMVD
jgi:cardiolipin synthase